MQDNSTKTSTRDLFNLAFNSMHPVERTVSVRALLLAR